MIIIHNSYYMMKHEAHQKDSKRSRVELNLVVIAVRRKNRPSIMNYTYSPYTVISENALYYKQSENDIQ